jgi:hypothetical protein
MFKKLLYFSSTTPEFYLCEGIFGGSLDSSEKELGTKKLLLTGTCFFKDAKLAEGFLISRT